MDLAAWFGPVNSGLVLLILTMLLRNLQNFQLMQTFVARQLNRRARRLAALIDPYLSITIHEYDAGRMTRSDVFAETKAYLDGAVGTRDDVRHLNAEDARGGGGGGGAGEGGGGGAGSSSSKGLVLSMADGEEVEDHFRGATLWWSAHCEQDDDKGRRGGGGRASQRRSYRLVFHECHRDLVRSAYLPHVRDQGRAFMAMSRQRKLYTNIPSSRWGDDGHAKTEVTCVRSHFRSYMCSLWTEVVFKHPKTFETLAMDPEKKREIIDDLDMFKNGKEQHRRVGKAWKRGYLLHGPPGTGKSTMVAAMANYLGYDVYDMELTSVHTNTDLRKLLIQTTSKSIIVIEDVDCSSNLTGRRKATGDGEDDDDDAKTTTKKVIDRGGGGGGVGGDSKVTLSGLLNFIDGLWSAFGEERLIVLTTNHVEDLDPALIRTGRMDKKIEMSYCDFETFKSMAKIHLDVDDHEMFAAVERLLPEVDLVPADVGEHLTAKNPRDDAGACLARLVNALQEAKAKKDAAERQDEDNGVVV
uniref:AAA-type ATPase n=3 Tax=Oryza sativa subsp. japonica TaxID=39947 RepID=Q10BW5_ORYSJ|nr:putative AAA-type ATPase [Oryza sativa Japonica Group]ABF99404.1 ATPase, AAA family protein, expressed [Oryza sativa Japonica Group]